jgi:ABC-type Fe3+/spermidine/putrescine transport system ATPase subunit
MQSQSLAIEMAGLTKQFGRHRAVDTLNLAVHSGSVFGFLGPNGAGKTTTIRMLLGLIRPTQGSARLSCRTSARLSNRPRSTPSFRAVTTCGSSRAPPGTRMGATSRGYLSRWA